MREGFRIQDSGFGRALRTMGWVCLSLATGHLSLLFAQQPQAQPLFNVNSKGVQGVGPGNWTYGADVHFYVDASAGSDTSGNGSAGNPYQTIGRALQSIPVFVSQHYLIHLAPGTYHEQAEVTGRYFGSTEAGDFNRAAVEIKGDPASPDSYVISGASAGAPTTPIRDYAVFCSHSNCILNGVSLQYVLRAGFFQMGGSSVVSNVTARHVDSTTGNWMNLGLWVRGPGVMGLSGTITIDDTESGILADQFGNIVNGFSPTYPVSNLPALSGLAISGVHPNGKGAVALEGGTLEITAPVSVTCNETGYGLMAWEHAFIALGTVTISDCVTGAYANWNSYVVADTPTVSNASIGFEAHGNSMVGSSWQAPVLNSVTTPYKLSDQSVASYTTGDQTGSLASGTLSATGAVSISAGGTNQNVALTPSGSGATVLNGRVGVGVAEPVAKLDVNGPIRSGPVLFSALPVCNSALEGARQPVLDSTTQAWGDALAGGGSYHVLAYCNGLAWTVVAK